MNNYKPDNINLVHYLMLKYQSSFKEIKEHLSLINDNELIDYINLINENSGETKIPLRFEEEYTKIQYSKRKYAIHHFKKPQKTLKIMLVSDKHIDHIDSRINYINQAYEEATKKGVDYIFDLGDILNGPKSKVHNPEKCITGTLEGSLDLLTRFHPTHIPTYFITGNHDIKFMETDFCNIGKIIEKECKNMFFLDNLFTIVDIDGLVINLTHGSLEEKSLKNLHIGKEHKYLTSNNPRIICQGHFHRTEEAIENKNILLCQVPSLKSGTDICKKGECISEIGVVILTINELRNNYEIEYEKIPFTEMQKSEKSELTLKKTIS